jgi:hypothetical protein
MRVTLEELKAMSDRDLDNHWIMGKWPFDYAAGCHKCLSMHARGWCSIPEHTNFTTSLPPKIQSNGVIEYIRAHIDELYAARLFYDSLYPQTINDVVIPFYVPDPEEQVVY